MVIYGREKVGIKTTKNPKAFFDYSQTIDDVYENLDHYNPTKKRRLLIKFDDLKFGNKFNWKIKAINNKIEKNKAQYNLDRHSATISALSWKC